MLQHRFPLEVFADYHQFYVQDGGINPPAPTDWTDGDVERRAKAADNIVVICPLRNATVPVILDVYSHEPALVLADCDHAVRCSIDLPTGELQVHESTGTEVLRHTVTPGIYALVALYSGLATIEGSGLEGADTYRLVLWPIDSASPLTVLKFCAQ